MDIWHLVAYLIRFSVKIFPHFKPEKILKMKLVFWKKNIFGHAFVSKTVLLVKGRFFSEFTFQMSLLWILSFVKRKRKKKNSWLSVCLYVNPNNSDNCQNVQFFLNSYCTFLTKHLGYTISFFYMTQKCTVT